MKKEKLTIKERKFVKNYIKNDGNGVKSALESYDTTDYKTASNIASTNLDKPRIQKAIQEALPDELLAEKHLGLFQQRELAYFTFPKDMPEDEIKQHVEDNGLELINIGYSKNGKLAFYSIPNSNAIKGALDMAYKLKGSYAPEKKDIKAEVIDTTLSIEEMEKLKSLINK